MPDIDIETNEPIQTPARGSNLIEGQMPTPIVDDRLDPTDPAKDYREAYDRREAERKAVAGEPEAPAPKLPKPTAGYRVGDQVEVHAMGYWYEGTVVKVGPKRVHVHYVTGSGAEHTKDVNPADHRGTGFGTTGPLIRKP